MILNSTKECGQIFGRLLGQICPLIHHGLSEFWEFVHCDNFVSEEGVWVVSQRVDISEVVHVDIVDNSTDPVVWRGVIESEESFHPIEPAYDVKVVVPSEFLNFTIRKAWVTSHLGVWSPRLTVVML